MDNKAVTSVSLEPNDTQDIKVEAIPPQNVEADTYQIPISASTSNSSAELTLEAVITGSYDLKISTPNEVLSDRVTAGRSKKVEIVVTNTGTSPLIDVELDAETPSNWEVEFDTETVHELAPGASETVTATISAPKDAIAGDYVVEFTATTDQAKSEMVYRVSVETSTLWGIVAVLIIAGVVVGLYFIIRKYGRR